ncbi:hypothetical protein OFEAOIEE_LOCUS620 [Methylorubrum extorquens]
MTPKFEAAGRDVAATLPCPPTAVQALIADGNLMHTVNRSPKNNRLRKVISPTELRRDGRND